MTHAPHSVSFGILFLVLGGGMAMISVLFFLGIFRVRNNDKWPIIVMIVLILLFIVAEYRQKFGFVHLSW